jgi:endoglycosylceramidase
MMRGALGAVVALGLACSSSSGGPASSPVSWHVSNGFLRDAQGRAVVLRGANVSGKDKTPPWWDFQGPADFARLRTDWGMNALRLVIEWAALEPEKGQYDAAYLDAIAQRVAWADAANLEVIVDMHQDVFGQGFAMGGGDGAPVWSCDASNYSGFMPTSPWALENLEAGVVNCYDGFWKSNDLQAHYAEAWRRVAARLASYGNVVGFDVMNEPYWGSHGILSFEQDLLQPLYERVVPIVRSAAPSWVAFIEPSSARNLGGTTRLTTPSFSDFVYAPHSYDTNAESGGGFDPSHRPAIIGNIEALAKEAKTLGGALWIGEYGGTATEPGIADYMTAQYDGMGAVATGSTYWDYTKGGYGMLAADGSEAQPLVDTLVRPYPERVAGDPVSWSYDASSSTFSLTYDASAAIAAPTVISVPTRLYPNGYAVECGGCAWTRTAGSLSISAIAGPVVVTIRPHGS